MPGLAAVNNMGNQLLFTGSVSDWDLVAGSGLAGGLGATVGYGISKGVSSYIGSGWSVLGFPTDKAAQAYNGAAGATGALGSIIYGSTVTSEIDNNGIPRCVDANVCLSTRAQ